MDFYNQIIIGIVSGIVSTLCSAFLLFFAGVIIFIRPRVKISRKIAYGMSYSEGKPAYKFQIVNKSYFITARDFDIHLYAIHKVKNEYDNTYTTFHKEVDFELLMRGLNNLGTNKSKLVLSFIRKFYKEYTTSFIYRISTIEDIKQYYSKYEALRLNVSYTDSLGKKQFVKQDFDLNKPVIFEGEFSNDGSLNKIIPKVVL